MAMGSKKGEKIVMMGMSRVKMGVTADAGLNKDIVARFQEQDAYKQQFVEIVTMSFQQRNVMMVTMKMEMGAVQIVKSNPDSSAEELNVQESVEMGKSVLFLENSVMMEIVTMEMDVAACAKYKMDLLVPLTQVASQSVS